MNLRDLQYIVAVADLRNFNRAAEHCHVSQPSLSKQIQKVEDSLGVALFERSNRKVSVTPIGEAILRHARQVLQETEAMRRLARESGDPLAGDLRLGIIPTLAPYLLPSILPALAAALPKLQLQWREATTAQITADLKHGSLDAVLAALPLGDEEIVEQPLFEEAFYLAVPKSHPLHRRKYVTTADIVEERLLLLDDGHCLRAQALDLCQIAPTAGDAFRATSLETLRQMVAAGYGVTLMPELAIPVTREAIIYLPFATPTPARSIGIAWRKTSPRHAVLERMAAIIARRMTNKNARKTRIIPI